MNKTHTFSVVERLSSIFLLESLISSLNFKENRISSPAMFLFSFSLFSSLYHIFMKHQIHPGGPWPSHLGHSREQNRHCPYPEFLLCPLSLSHHPWGAGREELGKEAAILWNTSAVSVHTDLLIILFYSQIMWLTYLLRLYGCFLNKFYFLQN